MAMALKQNYSQIYFYNFLYRRLKLHNPNLQLNTKKRYSYIRVHFRELPGSVRQLQSGRMEGLALTLQRINVFSASLQKSVYLV